MSSVKGDNKTLIDAGTILAPGLMDGRVKCIVDEYTASTLANPSTITMGGKLTKGAVVIGGFLSFEALGGSVTLEVGDAASVSRYISAASATSAGVVSLGEAGGTIGYTTTESDADNLDTQILITISGSGTADGEIRLVVFYTND